MHKKYALIFALSVVFIGAPLYILIDFVRPRSGQILVASDSISDERFANTVIYIEKHTLNGARGYVINKPLSGNASDTHDGGNAQWGGPLSPDTYFTITPPADNARTLDIACTNKDGVDLTAPYFIGYTGWGRLQLNYEIFKNRWVVRDFDVSYVNSVLRPKAYAAAKSITTTRKNKTL